VFWLSDRSTVVDMLGNYDSLPDRYTLDDHLHAIAPLTVGGVIWSDAGAADPLAALRWARDQDDEIFADRTDDERRQLFHDTALTWLAARPR